LSWRCRDDPRSKDHLRRGGGRRWGGRFERCARSRSGAAASRRRCRMATKCSRRAHARLLVPRRDVPRDFFAAGRAEVSGYGVELLVGAPANGTRGAKLRPVILVMHSALPSRPRHVEAAAHAARIWHGRHLGLLLRGVPFSALLTSVEAGVGTWPQVRVSGAKRAPRIALALAKCLVRALGLCTFRRTSRPRLSGRNAVPTDQSDEASVRTTHDE
jgi:hypothetical protein